MKINLPFALRWIPIIAAMCLVGALVWAVEKITGEEL